VKLISCLFALPFSNVILQLITLLRIIHDVLGSNIGDDTGYPADMFAMAFSGFQRMKVQCPKLGHNRFLPHPFQFNIHTTN
jgi:hypothetical protein